MQFQPNQNYIRLYISYGLIILLLKLIVNFEVILN